MKKIFALLTFSKKEVASRAQIERQKFSEEVRNQFKELKDKGLSIPVFTL